MAGDTAKYCEYINKKVNQLGWQLMKSYYKYWGFWCQQYKQKSNSVVEVINLLTVKQSYNYFQFKH